LGEQWLTLARQVQDPACLMGAYYALGATSYWLGEVIAARALLEQGIALYDFRQDCSHAFVYGHDSGVACLSYVAFALWFLGYPDQALKRSREALALARELAHPNSLAFALNFAANVHSMRREILLVQERAEAAMALAAEQELPHWVWQGKMWKGWLLLAKQGQAETAIPQIHQAITAMQATGARQGRVGIIALLARAYAAAGQVEKGLRTLAEALALVKETGEGVLEPMLFWLKGELTLQKSGVPNTRHLIFNPTAEEAEACFQQAIEIARRQSTKLWELRAVMSLSRLWQKKGRKAEAHKMLAEIFGWFAEGFDTADLREAKALLEELGVAENIRSY